MLNVLIVDDEAPARAELAFLLKQVPLVEMIGEASGAKEAIKKMIANPPDLILLDINMPQVSGMKLAEAMRKIKKAPFIVFVTAYPEHALDAFHVDAVDYLLKPVDKKKLEKALEKVMRARASRLYSDIPKTLVKRIRVKGEDGIHYIEVSTIDFIEAQKNILLIHVGNKIYHVTSSLVKFQEELPKDMFCQIYRNIIVNINRIQSLEPDGEGMQVFCVSADSTKVVKLPVARRRIHDLKTGMGIK